MTAGPLTADSEDAGVGSGAYRLTFHVIATTGFVLAAYDRHVFGVLLESIRADFGLSDTTLGLLQGFAFALCYATAALPVAYLIDKGSRVRVAGWCIVLWSLGTACCGFATGLIGLAAGRTITAISEAGYSPAALSLISDTMARRNVPRATAIYLIAPSLGLGLAFIVGGALLRYFSRAGGLHLPLVGLISSWQSVLVLSAAPGVLLAVVIGLVFQEPPRRGAIRLVAHSHAHAAVPAGSTFKQVMTEHGAFLIPYIAGCTAVLLVLFTIAAWGTALASRTFRIDPAAAATLIGPATLLGGIAGPLAASAMLGNLSGREVLRRMTTIVLIATIATSLILPVLAYTTNIVVMVSVIGIIVFFVSAVAPMIVSPIQILIPSTLRGRFHAVASFLFTVLAGGIGPAAVGFLLDRILGDASEVGKAIALTCCSSCIVGLLLMSYARRSIGRYRRAP